MRGEGSRVTGEGQGVEFNEDSKNIHSSVCPAC